jgi:hypothetical protein
MTKNNSAVFFLLITLFLLPVTNSLYGDKVTVIVGEADSTGQQQYLAPNIQNGRPLKGKWNDGKKVKNSFIIGTEKSSASKTNEQQSSDKNLNNIVSTQESPFGPDNSKKYLHIREASKDKTPLKSIEKEDLDQIIQGVDTGESGDGKNNGVREFNGSEGGTWIAAKDGNLKISPCLMTIKGATLTIRLLEADGTEITFNDEPLLFWKRFNDKELAPLIWKGKSDENSMYLQSGGDYSPRENLEYSIKVKEGQKLIVEISGSPILSNSVRLESDNLR